MVIEVEADRLVVEPNTELGSSTLELGAPDTPERNDETENRSGKALALPRSSKLLVVELGVKTDISMELLWTFIDAKKFIEEK